MAKKKKILLFILKALAKLGLSFAKRKLKDKMK
jgi:hypothetical protein